MNTICNFSTIVNTTVNRCLLVKIYVLSIFFSLQAFMKIHVIKETLAVGILKYIET